MKRIRRKTEGKCFFFIFVFSVKKNNFYFWKLLKYFTTKFSRIIIFLNYEHTGVSFFHFFTGGGGGVNFCYFHVHCLRPVLWGVIK